MNSSWEGPLLRATVLTFEDLGLVLPVLDLSDAQRAAPWEAAVEIDFHGPLQGQLVLAVAVGVLPAVVANMLGTEGADTPKARRDALGELGNVICGNALPAIAGPEATFDIEPPRVIEPAAMPARATFDAAICIGLADGRAEVRLRARGMDQSPAAEAPRASDRQRTGWRVA